MTDARTREWDEMYGQIAQEWDQKPTDDKEEQRAKAMLRRYFVAHLRISRPTEGQHGGSD